MNAEDSYIVVVCPKCRRHAQIVENKGQKTIRCQNCGAGLQLRRLRRLHRAATLEEAVAARASVQAGLAGKNINARSVIEIPEIPAKTGNGYGGNNPLKFVLATIRPGETVSLTELETEAGKREIAADKLGEALQVLLENGELSEPAHRHFRRV
jgi:DNA-directed RNA polymerase subunit RPC12/RpoP